MLTKWTCSQRIQSKLCNKVCQIRSRGVVHQNAQKTQGLRGGCTSKIQQKHIQNTTQYIKIQHNTHKIKKTLRLGRVPLEANGDLIAMAVLYTRLTTNLHFFAWAPWDHDPHGTMRP